ncbi:alpha/beta-hydrolase [Corynespora cassiicola Philippines]|uniref:Alpha/beta-hydrolase n=1 Tax=Corynespora cassiicola Philippines TaxID=1448308 RepID=A0A2T2NIF9_CORCC|nr:alpha/beta-hydrolase [Corynespora cassiicola Philippines]
MSEQSQFKNPGTLGLVSLFGRVAFAALTRLVSYPFRSVRSQSLHKDVLNGALRAMLDRITIAQVRYLNPPTTNGYLDFCKAKNWTPNTLEVKEKDLTAVAHWVGDPDAKYVMLYCHGGGYATPASGGHFRYLDRLVEDMNKDAASPSLAVLILAYALLPDGKYPTQLREAAAVLSHLVNVQGRSPSTIILAGDSAGANIVMSLLSHLLHPHPAIQSIQLQQPLCGAFLISPWVSFRTDYPSMKKNQYLDLLSQSMLRRWAAMFLGKANPSNPELDPSSVSGDAYTEPSSNPSSWWIGLPGLLSSAFVWTGGDEVFLDSIRELENSMKKGWADSGARSDALVFMETAHEPHIGPITDIMIKSKEFKTEQQEAINAWIKSRIFEH